MKIIYKRKICMEIKPNGESGAENPEDVQNENGDKVELDQEAEAEIEKAGESNPFEKAALGWRKRVDKLTYQKKARDEKIERLEEEIRSLKKRQSSGASDRLENISTMEELEDYKLSLKSEKRKMLSLLEGGDDEVVIDGKEYSRRDVLGYIDRLDDILDSGIPKRAEGIRTRSVKAKKRSEIEELAKKKFPELQNEDSPMSRWVAEQMESEFLHENLPMLLAYAFNGLEVNRLREKVAAKKPAQKSAQAAQQGKPNAGGEGISKSSEGRRLSIAEALRAFKS